MLELFNKSQGYLTISLNSTQENPSPEVYLVDRSDLVLSNDPLQTLPNHTSSQTLPNPALPSNLLPENPTLSELPVEFTKILIDLNFYGETQ